MNVYSMLFAVLVLLSGCGEPNLDNAKSLDKILTEAIDEDKIQKRGEEGEKLIYAPNEHKPYTGWIKSMYDDGQVKGLLHAQDGIADGLATFWYKNGQKRSEGKIKDGKVISCEVWKPNGEKCLNTTLKDGNGVLVIYKHDGAEKIRTTFMDGIEVKP